MAPISDSYSICTGIQGRWTETFIRNNKTGCSSVKNETIYDNHVISITYEEKAHFREAVVRVSLSSELSDRFPLRVIPGNKTFTADGDEHDAINAVQKEVYRYVTHVKKTLDYNLDSLASGYIHEKVA